MDTCHYKGLKGSNRKVSLWGINMAEIQLLNQYTRTQGRSVRF